MFIAKGMSHTSGDLPQRRTRRDPCPSWRGNAEELAAATEQTDVPRFEINIFPLVDLALMGREEFGVSVVILLQVVVACRYRFHKFMKLGVFFSYSTYIIISGC